MKITKNKSTKQEYLQKGISLFKSFHGSSGLKSKIYTIGEFKLTCSGAYETCQWAANELSQSVRKSTWRKYRCSLREIVKLLLRYKSIDQHEYDRCCNILLNVTGGENKNLPKRTSSMKAKSLTKKEWSELGDKIKKSKSKWSQMTILWIHCNMHTGMRPCESQNAVLEDKKIIITNAKNTNGRSHGTLRTIPLNHLDNKTIHLINEHLRISNNMYENGEWENYYLNCRTLIHRLAKKLWPKKKKLPTLYTGRHQFAANNKASGNDLVSIAYLLGHISTKTSVNHYGRKKNGNKSRTPDLSNITIPHIKVKNSTYKPNNVNSDPNKPKIIK
ncbi:hypothetical protein [Photobacterium leiognathi]|uniref:hypothetical protein n=1 Tax=Photobacterium leiognathi TaxID=553611 RepID=UPI0029821C9F|nr:hypothetical protein [Photobacterium leiognathi]